MKEVVIVSACRTAIGAFGGALRDLNAPLIASVCMEEAIKRTAHLHLDHIRTSGDPFEMGTARPLDFGHWSAHRLELHGQLSLRGRRGSGQSRGLR